MPSPITVGNLVLADLDAQLDYTRRMKACLCGSRNDVRRGRALWGYGLVCRRCRKAWVDRHGVAWQGEHWLMAQRRKETRRE